MRTIVNLIEVVIAVSDGSEVKGIRIDLYIACRRKGKSREYFKVVKDEIEMRGKRER